LPSASQLPIIVAMNFLFRTEAEHGSEQSPRQQYCSVNSALPNSSCSRRRLRALAHTLSPWSPRRSLSLGMPPTKNPADHPLRRGAACCARCDQPDQRHPSAAPARCQLSRLASDSDLRPPTGTHLKRSELRTKSFVFPAFLTGSASQTEFDVTPTKQTTEKFLTGARTHIKDFKIRRLIQLDRRGEPAPRGGLLCALFERHNRAFNCISTRHSLTSRIRRNFNKLNNRRISTRGHNPSVCILVLPPLAKVAI
jgi:hypothetical protein